MKYIQDRKKYLVLNAIGIFCLICLLIGQSAYSTTDEEIREKIHDTIKVRHPVDQPEWWRSLGSQAPHVIISMYNETSSTYEKIRLIEALAWFDDPAAVSFLKGVYEKSGNAILKEAALKSIAVSQNSNEQEFIDKGMKRSSSKAKVRIARAMERSGDPEKARLVDGILKNEKDPWVINQVREQRRDREKDRTRNQRRESASQKPSVKGTSTDASETSIVRKIPSNERSTY